MINLGRFTISLESYWKTRAGLGYFVIVDGFVRLRNGVVRRTSRKLHDVNVAVAVAMATAVRLMYAHLRAESRRFRSG